MIGFIGAMQIEIDGIRDLMTDKNSEIVSGIEYVSGKLNGCEIVTAVCGIGKVFAAVCTQTMVLKYSPDLIVNTGVAGSLSAELKIGDIAVALSVVQHDMDTSPIGDPKGLISGINLIYINTSPKASELLNECVRGYGINTVSGIIASGDQFIASAAKKAEISGNFGAIACEMECASIGHVCYLNRVPFAVLRAISDSADEVASEDFPEFAKKAADNYVRVVGEFCRRSADTTVSW